MAVPAGAILVVDDDKINRLVLSNQLEMEGYAVTTAEHGRRALDLLRAQPFDVVLLDLIMPEMDGFQVLGHMRADECLRHIPVLVISALDEVGSAVRSIQMGATDHLTKPCDPFLLRARINASLATKRLHDQEAEYRRQVALLTQAAADLEAGSFAPGALAGVAARADPLGQLARMFQHMAEEVYAREQQLHHQNQFKSALIGRITHELRSPFVAAGLSVQVLQRYLDRAMIDETREQLRVLERQLAAGRAMIDNAITFASLAARQTELRLEQTDLAGMIPRVVAPLNRLAASRDVTIAYDIARDLPYVCVDGRQLGEAIQHLVHNAIKFNRHGGTVSIACRVEGGDLVFAVEDSGPGIPPDKMDVIWEAFGQAADDVRRGVEGLGLGLALVRCVAEAHRGVAFGRSTLGQGCVFGFRIPAAGERREETSRPADKQTSAR